VRRVPVWALGLLEGRCGACDITHMSAVAALEQDFEGLSYDGLKVQHFDPERDAESSETPVEIIGTLNRSGSQSLAGAVSQFAAEFALATVPGLGLARTGRQLTMQLQQRLAKGADIKCTVTALRASGLHQPKAGRVTSPYMVATLKMDGLDSKLRAAGMYSSRSKSLRGAGGTCAFPKAEHTLMIGLPSDLQAAKSAYLVISVKDDLETLSGLAKADPSLGTAAIGLSQLVSGLEQTDHVECDVNLQLARGTGFAEICGMLRVTVALDTDRDPRRSSKRSQGSGKDATFDNI